VQGRWGCVGRGPPSGSRSSWPWCSTATHWSQSCTASCSVTQEAQIVMSAQPHGWFRYNISEQLISWLMVQHAYFVFVESQLSQSVYFQVVLRFSSVTKGTF
jgi:hypothetical protein